MPENQYSATFGKHSTKKADALLASAWWTKGEAENSLAVLNEKWGKQYPSAVRVWNDNFVYFQRLFKYPAEIRKMIYTTNAIESFNSALRKVTDRKAAFPNEMAVMKILYLRTLDVVKKWTMPYPNWSVIRGKLDFLLGIGWDL